MEIKISRKEADIVWSQVTTMNDINFLVGFNEDDKKEIKYLTGVYYHLYTQVKPYMEIGLVKPGRNGMLHYDFDLEKELLAND